MEQEWRKVDQLAATLESNLGSPPQVVMVLGSGLGGVSENLKDRRSIGFDGLAAWPQATVEGHAGRLHRGSIGGTEVLVQAGRVHLYEGYSPAEVVRPIRAALTWGAKVVILTNAAGGIDPSLKPGDLMMIEDQLNLTGSNPLIGANDGTRGPRFPAMNGLYDPRLRAIALDRAAEIGVTLRTGVYAGLTGPSYETPAEVAMLAGLGASAVGMSTVLEAIAARHLGARVAGLSCITNMAAGRDPNPPSHDEVQRIGLRASDDLSRLLGAMADALAGAP